VRVLEVFVDELDLRALGFEGVVPKATGRPAYHPATLLKIYLYGYLNRIQSSRRLERETQRNIELMWLTGRLTPDFKTIADFRRDSGPAIRAACAQFIVLCRQFNLFTRTVIAIDGSKFKAVNNRDKNFTVAKVAKRIEQVEASIARYLAALDRADREDGDVAEAKTVRLKEKIEGLRRQMQSLKEIGRQVEAAPDKQVSLTDPDARSMATSGKGAGIVGYNVQIAVDAEHHLIVAHEVTNVGSDRAQLTAMGRKAREASGCEEVTVLADRGYYNGDEVLACEGTGILPVIPKTQTSGNPKRGLLKRLGLSAPEIGVADAFVAPQRRRIAAKREPASLQHITPVRDLQSHVRILLDPQHCHSTLLDFGDDLEHRLHDDGRKAERRLVEQQQARLSHQAAGDRDHLQLTAR